MSTIIKFLSLLFFLFLTCSLYAQKDKEQLKSKAEDFSSQSGRLLKKEFVSIGELKGVDIKVIYYVDLVTKASTSSIKLEMEKLGDILLVLKQLYWMQMK